MICREMTAEKLRELLIYSHETGLFHWRVNYRTCPHLAGKQAGGINGCGYVQIAIGGKAYLAHRLAWLWVYGAWPSFMVDHIDGNRQNNRLSNLRDVTRAVNGQNQKAAQRHNATGLLGVTQIKGRKKNPYQAAIFIGGRYKYLGVFPSPEAASNAYLVAKRKFHEGCTL